ncbi:SDR family NAD(P)-dependent oxidoreductase [Candidatus Sumerlaeota bacterium]|nr:SDR family NAD(P)-dependent oxidoreductase [Candidatus Sumerlaeota bacterium]
MARKALITGGAGFIGANLVHRLMAEGWEIIVVDNLSRVGSDRNLDWLRSQGAFEFVRLDIRDYEALKRLCRKHNNLDAVFHLAAQVAVTTSVINPREDFEINALGTFNLLEAIRESNQRPAVFHASTNKVYGSMADVAIVETPTRYEYRDLPEGVDETFPLDFYSPYGCSKGAADQYVRDYWRIYHIPTVVLRQSCVYGYRQFGIEDQGWVAWFIIAALKGRPITIYGDGKQVRDILFIDDLIEAYLAAYGQIERIRGEVYNIGGGPRNTLAVWSEFGPLIEELAGRKIEVTYSDWRPADQNVFVSDISRAMRDFGWEPVVDVRAGIERLYRWVADNLDLFDSV